MVKFADDITLSGLILNSDDSIYRTQISSLVSWCETNNLILNIDKTKEMIIDFSKNQSDRAIEPIVSNRKTGERVNCFRVLGTHMMDTLKWTTQVEENLKKAQQRMYIFTQIKIIWCHWTYYGELLSLSDRILSNEFHHRLV